eukprot:6480072-Amphidinium_carterae.1
MHHTFLFAARHSRAASGFRAVQEAKKHEQCFRAIKQLCSHMYDTATMPVCVDMLAELNYPLVYSVAMLV